MRNANILGQALRAAHHKTGWHLAIEYLSTKPIIGVEQYQIPHVKDKHTDGHRILHESGTTIVALMQAGESMALGVANAIPTAMFLHAKEPINVQPVHLKGQSTTILVDGVINSGATVPGLRQTHSNLTRHHPHRDRGWRCTKEPHQRR